MASITPYDHVHNFANHVKQLYLRALAVLRKVVDGIDGGFYVVDDVVTVYSFKELDRDDANVLFCRGINFVNARQALHRALNRQTNTLLYFEWRSARVNHANDCRLHLDHRYHLLLERTNRHRANHNDSNHQQVGRYRVFGEPRNDCVHISC